MKRSTSLPLNDRQAIHVQLLQCIVSLILLYLWLAINQEIGWRAAALLLVSITLLGLPAYLLIRIGTGLGGAAELLTSLGAGLAIAGVGALVLRGLFGSSVSIEIVAFVLIIAVALAAVWFRRHAVMVTPPRIGYAACAISLAIIGIPLSYILMTAFLAGTGPFPHIILSSDDAVHLSMVQALLASDQVPPVSLTFAGGLKLYHYGALESAAYLVRLTGIPAHVALSYICKPLWATAITAAGWIILRKIALGDSVFVAGAGLIALTLPASHDYMRPRFRNLTAWLGHLSGKDWADVSYMQIKLPHAASMAALSLSWLAIALMLSWESMIARILVALLIGCLSVLDIFYFAATGLVLGIWSLMQAYRERSLYPLVPPGIALAIGFASQHATSSTAAGFRIGFSFFGNTYMRENSADMLIACLPLFALIALACFVNRTEKTRKQATLLAISVACLTLITNLLTLDYSTAGDNNFNWIRWISLVPVLTGVVAIFGWRDIFVQTRRWPKWTAIALFVYAVPLPLIRYPVAGLQALADPRRGDMNVDTSSLAEILRRVPIKDSLIVASDLRYPVIDFRYVDKNPLISALYGHRCYLCNWDGDQDIAGADQRFAEVKLLRTETWPPELSSIAAKNGWTHLIVRKDGPHAKVIPLQLVYENNDYQLYRFPN